MRKKLVESVQGKEGTRASPRPKANFLLSEEHKGENATRKFDTARGKVRTCALAVFKQAY